MSPFAAWMLACSLLALAATCGLYWALGGRAFADFATYADIAAELGARDAGVPVLGPEGVSRGLLQILHLVFADADRAVAATALVCQILVALAVLDAARRPEIRPENLFLAVALFAPLLALVTLRATPAYLVCAYAIAHARLSRRPRMRWAALAGLGSLLFHLSAVFVLGGALVAAVVPSRAPRMTWFGIAAGAGVGALILRQSLDVEAVLALAGGVTAVANPLLAERLTYFTDLTTPVSGAHLVYFALVSLLVYRIVFAAPPHPSDRLILSLYVMYCACLVSPVIAFRSSYYLLLPLVVTARRPVLPFGEGPFGQALHATVCAGLLAFQTTGVVSRS